jgi:hypothetical protein
MNNHSKHIDQFLPILIGKKVSAIRRLTNEEIENFGWYKNPLVIVLEDNTQIVLMADDEGNDGGAALLYNAQQKIDEVAYTI